MTQTAVGAWTVREARPDERPLLEAWLGHPLPAQAVLVAVDAAGHLGAMGRLRAGIGLSSPRFWYHVGCAVHAAAELGLFQRQRTLLLGNDLTGASELCDLLPAPGASPEDLAALAALIAHAVAWFDARPDQHGERLIVELAGPLDAEGRSPFWQGLGRHFYAGDPAAARQRFGLRWRSHAAVLLPRQPVYAAFLPEAAQQAVGQVRADLQPLAALLRTGGLQAGEHVNVEDGGPVFERRRA